MKKQVHFLIPATLLIFCILQAQAQTISLQMDAQGTPSILVNGKAKANQASVKLKIPANGTLRFQLNNQAGPPPLITLKSASDTPPANTPLLDLENLQQALTAASPLSTDSKLVLTAGNATYNLNQPFKLLLASQTDHSKIISVTISPQLASAAQPNQPQQAPADAKVTAVSEPAYHPGSAVYDALKLSASTDVTATDLKAIIQYYYPSVTINTPADVVASVTDNPFLSPVINDGYVKRLKPDPNNKTESSSQVLSSLSMSSIGGLDVTTITDGLAKFLVNRVKEELSMAFFQKLADTIKKNRDLQTLFPKTASLLANMNTQVYDYKMYLQNLRESFKEDIEALDTNLPGILPLHQKFFANNPKLTDAIITGCYLTKQLKNQAHPGDIIANFPVDTIAVYEKNKNWTGTIQTLQLISESLRDTSSNGNSYWVNLKYLRQLAANKTSLKIYLGLVLQQAVNNYNEVPFETSSLTAVLKAAAAKYDMSYDIYTQYKQYVMGFAVKTDAINQMIANYRKPANDSLAVELYKKYFDAAADLFQYSIQAAKLPGMDQVIPPNDDFFTGYPQYLKITKSISDLAIDINRRNYSAAINETVNIYQQIDTVSDNQLHIPKSTIDVIVHYGSFMAAIATAKTSDQMESAIEAFVLPAGSFSVKRESPFNVAINAYTGLFLGHEGIQGVTSHQFFNAYGLSAPVGISISRGDRRFFNPWWGQGHASYSLFISLIDIGAVAAYRFKDDTTSQVPKIQLKNIFSPGAFLSIGIPKTPLSINLGAQIGPNLRQIDNNNTTEPSQDASNRMYWRFSAGLVVDIPLLNLYTKSK